MHLFFFFAQVELIYVNPEGPVSDPNNPVAAGADIRRAFARMGFDDQVSTILIGAGHAIGKAHGDPNGTLTSGLEGPWTTTPTTWSNEVRKSELSKYPSDCDEKLFLTILLFFLSCTNSTFEIFLTSPTALSKVQMEICNGPLTMVRQ